MDNFRTVDITLAATLVSSGFQLQDIVVEGKQGTFLFGLVPANTITNFYAGNLLVDPINFHTNLKRLSARVKDLVRQNM